jgi:hypothetical protein
MLQPPCILNLKDNADSDFTPEVTFPEIYIKGRYLKYVAFKNLELLTKYEYSCISGEKQTFQYPRDGDVSKVLITANLGLNTADEDQGVDEILESQKRLYSKGSGTI